MDQKTQIQLLEKRPSVSEKIVAYCKLTGVRSPVKKLLVADHLENINGYADAPTIYIGMRINRIKISHAAVYEALRWMTIHGFIERKAGSRGTSSGAIYRISNAS